MLYLLKFIVNVVAIITLFYVGITLLFTPEKANFSYYIFVALMSIVIYHTYIKKKLS